MPPPQESLSRCRIFGFRIQHTAPPKGKKGKGRYCSSWGTPPQSYGASLAVRDHTFHPTQVNAPRLTPAIQACARFTCPGGMEG